MKKSLSIIAPLYNEADNVNELYKQIKNCWNTDLEKFSNQLILIDDGSTDNTFELASKIAKSDKRVIVIKFTKNFGHHIAITAGIDFTHSDYCVLMDSDLQDNPNKIVHLFEKITPQKPLIYTIRKTKKGSFFKRFTSSLFWKWINFASGLDIPKDQAMLRLFDINVLKKIQKYKKTIPFYAGIFADIKVDYDAIFVHQAKRNQGESKYNFKRLFNLFKLGTFGFGFKLKEYLKYLLITFSFLSVLLALWNIYYTLPLIILLIIFAVLYHYCNIFQAKNTPFNYDIETIVNE